MDPAAEHGDGRPVPPAWAQPQPRMSRLTPRCHQGREPSIKSSYFKSQVGPGKPRSFEKKKHPAPLARGGTTVWKRSCRNKCREGVGLSRSSPSDLARTRRSAGGKPVPHRQGSRYVSKKGGNSRMVAGDLGRRSRKGSCSTTHQNNQKQLKHEKARDRCACCDEPPGRARIRDNLDVVEGNRARDAPPHLGSSVTPRGQDVQAIAFAGTPRQAKAPRIGHHDKRGWALFFSATAGSGHQFLLLASASKNPGGRERRQNRCAETSLLPKKRRVNANLPGKQYGNTKLRRTPDLAGKGPEGRWPLFQTFSPKARERASQRTGRRIERIG